MTKQELLDFCVENAGKMASGKYRTSNVLQADIKRGRIIAFIIDQFGKGLILLEDVNGKEKKDLPNPLPAIPHHMDGWFRVVSPAKLGFPVYADSVVVTEQVSDEQPVVQVQAAKQVVQAHDESKSGGNGRVCRHSVCDPGWCHLKYIGVV